MENLKTLFDLIRVLAQRRYQMGEHAFAPLGLNHTEARLLTLLAEAGGSATQDSLSSQLFIDRSNAGRALKQLEHGGYVFRRKDEADKRTNKVEISATGGEAVEKIKQIRAKIVAEFFGDLKDEDAATIVDLLQSAIDANAPAENSAPSPSGTHTT